MSSNHESQSARSQPSDDLGARSGLSRTSLDARCDNMFAYLMELCDKVPELEKNIVRLMNEGWIFLEPSGFKRPLIAIRTVRRGEDDEFQQRLELAADFEYLDPADRLLFLEHDVGRGHGVYPEEI